MIERARKANKRLADIIRRIDRGGSAGGATEAAVKRNIRDALTAIIEAEDAYGTAAAIEEGERLQTLRQRAISLNLLSAGEYIAIEREACK